MTNRAFDITINDQSNLSALSSAVEAAAAVAVRAALAVATPAIAKETPVRSGFLRGSESTFQRGAFVGMFKADAPYASFVARGTSRQRANPFIDRGVSQAEGQMTSAFAAAFDREIGGF